MDEGNIDDAADIACGTRTGAVIRTVMALSIALGLNAGETSQPVVKVSGGIVQGTSAPPGGAVFKGIPYAQPPLGNLRWREPQAVTPWKGVRDATRFSAACIQNPFGTDNFLAPLAKMYGNPYAPRRIAMSEDCLYLNVWSPEWPPRSSAAVMFWIHGGSNLVGSANESEYDGSALARRGVVVVTINYRLGALGFFSHPELTRESPHHASGNYGLLDQIAALEWVRANIATFGGDPARVTVFGESAGAIDTGLLLCSPLSKGLFARAIMQSGPVFLSLRASPLEKGERFGEKVAEALQASGAHTIDHLRSLAPEAVTTKAIDVTKSAGNPGTVADGWFLRESPGDIFASGRQVAADFVIGQNGREMSAFRVSAESKSSSSGGLDQGASNIIKVFYGRSTPVVLGLYMLDSGLRRTEAADGWLNDVVGACPGMAMASLHARTGHHAYAYQFNREIPGKGQHDLGAFHSLEVPFVFGTLAAWNWLPFEKADYRLSDVLQTYWTNFARTGNPNSADLTGWKEFDDGGQSSLEFGKTGQVRLRNRSAPPFCDVNATDLVERLREYGGS
jgi:para-nitrobenzyl esterase